LRTTINISDGVVKEAEIIYETKNRSKAIEMAIKDAVRFNKLKKLKNLKSKISFDEGAIENLRKLEMKE
jgi:Arc/MetJ family transcription regulator